MTISTFAAKHHLNLRRADDDTFIIPGRQGHVYEYNDSELGVLIMPAPKKVRLWGHVRKAMLGAGMIVRQSGDHEGAVSFDPHNKKAVRLALKYVGARRKRLPSAAQLAALAKARTFIPGPPPAHAAL